MTTPVLIVCFVSVCLPLFVYDRISRVVQLLAVTVIGGLYYATVFTPGTHTITRVYIMYMHT